MAVPYTAAMKLRSSGAPLHSFAAFRTGRSVYTHQPQRRHHAARLAWDILAQRGSIIDLKLTEGRWTCRRSASESDHVEADWVRRALVNPSDEQQKIVQALRAIPSSAPPEAARTLAKRLRTEKQSMRAIAVRLAQEGFTTAYGTAFPVQCIRRLLDEPHRQRHVAPIVNPLEAICKRLTYNGAVNLRGTIVHPRADCPDALNGGRRLYTGLGKYTALAATGVENHLVTLKLAERREAPWLCLTSWGREVAQYLHEHHWDAKFPTS